ncbi:MAG: FKBP-type peptidyl-prolyl cis-trans isomerase [Planctomycetota bacterium]|nr:FKBP-type peptidyl-prolyl cis-trans isomerase [Planctomycetota bacterium]
MRARTASAVTLGLALSCAGCRSFDASRRTTRVETPSVRTTAGVMYEELMRGQGPCAETGDEVLLDYVVSLENGTRVDSTLDRGVPVPVRIGEAFVRGLDDGLAGICAEGRRRITVPPELAYGAEGVPGLVPPNATLVFEVHAVEVRPGKR